MSATHGCCDGVMSTPSPLPQVVTVVDVHGSRFLLEWLDRDVLAAAAALVLREPVRRPR
jgi:hypothetical protein